MGCLFLWGSQCGLPPCPKAKPRSYDDRGLFCTSDVQKRGAFPSTTVSVVRNVSGERCAPVFAVREAESPPLPRGTISNPVHLQVRKVFVGGMLHDDPGRESHSRSVVLHSTPALSPLLRVIRVRPPDPLPPTTDIACCQKATPTHLSGAGGRADNRGWEREDRSRVGLRMWCCQGGQNGVKGDFRWPRQQSAMRESQMVHDRLPASEK